MINITDYELQPTMPAEFSYVPVTVWAPNFLSLSLQAALQCSTLISQ